MRKLSHRKVNILVKVTKLMMELPFDPGGMAPDPLLLTCTLYLKAEDIGSCSQITSSLVDAVSLKHMQRYKIYNFKGCRL